MADDDQTGGQEQPDDQAQGAAGTTDTGDANTGDGGTDDSGKGKSNLTADQLAKALAETRAEAAASRKRAKAAEEALAKREEADLSETERLKKENERLQAAATAAEQRAQRALLRAEVAQAAGKLGFIDPDDAMAMLPADLAFDDDGAPVGVEDALKELAKRKPHLLRSEDDRPTGSAGPTGAPDAGRRSGSSRLTREKLKGMTAEQIKSLPEAEVHAALAAP